jgi:N-acetylglucosaminyldiphosphoundecaprenol N-acetyl-beta-D-mannosaminyltransferase
MNILGIKVDDLTREELLEKVDYFLSDQKFHQIATVNPEFILEAQKNEEFKNILNSCDLNIADGVGIKFAFWRYGKNLKFRMAGIDLVKKILKIASGRGLDIFLAANKDGLSTWEETRDAIIRIYPNLLIDGSNLNKNNVLYKIQNTRYQILLCNFGAPFQELFINRQKNDTIKLAIGVGGSFDFLTGKIKRAPVLVCRLGFEWFWRLLQKPDPSVPRRWKRIWNAVIVFPIRILLRK